MTEMTATRRPMPLAGFFMPAAGLLPGSGLFA